MLFKYIFYCLLYCMHESCTAKMLGLWTDKSLKCGNYTGIVGIIVTTLT